MTTLFDLPAVQPSPLISARRNLDRMEAHLADCVCEADKMAAQAEIDRQQVIVTELEAQAMRAGR